MEGKDDLYASIVRAQNSIKSNTCGMTDATMRALAVTINTIIDAEESKERPFVSRDKAASLLGVSTRTLGRMVEAGKIKPHRRGFLHQIYYIDEINELIEKK